MSLLRSIVDEERQRYKDHFNTVLQSLDNDSELLKILTANQEMLLADPDSWPIIKFMSVLKELRPWKPDGESNMSESWVYLWHYWTTELSVMKRKLEEIRVEALPLLKVVEKYPTALEKIKKKLHKSKKRQ